MKYQQSELENLCQTFPNGVLAILVYGPDAGHVNEVALKISKSTDFYQIFAHLALFIHCTVLHLSIAVKLLGISQVLEIPRIETIWWSLK